MLGSDVIGELARRRDIRFALKLLMTDGAFKKLLFAGNAPQGRNLHVEDDYTR
jgi:hypothetical protein